MFLLLVKFHSELPDAEVRRLMNERLSQFQGVPGLLQKYYAREPSTGDYVGVYLFDSEDSLTRYRSSELARGILSIYRVAGAPRIETLELLLATHENELKA
jgi:hypothetical protein